MKHLHKLLFSCLAGVVLSNGILEAARDIELLSSSRPSHVEYNNRILAKVNGKPITLHDVVKKMDMVFYRQFPEYREVPEARWQFYEINWKQILKDMVDKELVMAEAEDNKVPVNNGDIRQEMETTFGPNIIHNLDKAGLSYEEAWQILKTEYILKRMLFSRINMPAFRELTPLTIRQAYEKYAVENRHPEMWRYRVLSFRDKDPSRAADVATKAYELLTQDHVQLDALSEALTKSRVMTQDTSLNISEEFYHTPKDVSEMYRDQLAVLEENQFSQPISQKSRSVKTSLVRIFYLKNKDPEGVDPLEKVEEKIRNAILDKAITENTDAYLKKLHARYVVEEYPLADDYSPFELK